MSKLIIGITIGLMFSAGVSYGYRIAKPVPMQQIDNNTIVELNRVLEEFWDVLNGRYIHDIVTTIPSGTAEEGTTKLYYSGSTYRVYRYLNSGWRYWDNDG